jgi:hypothetical protein
MALPIPSGDLAVTSTISLAALVAWWSCAAWAQEPGAVALSGAGLPPDAAIMVELVRLLGAPGIALALGWALARWRPVLTLVVRHDLPEGSRLEVVSVERGAPRARPRDDLEEDTGSLRRDRAS